MGQRRGSFCAIERAVDEAHIVGFASVNAPLKKIEASDHHGQHIVKVVRNAASELSYGFHLLGLPKLVFQTFATSDFIECPLVGQACRIFSIAISN